MEPRQVIFKKRTKRRLLHMAFLSDLLYGSKTCLKMCIKNAFYTYSEGIVHPKMTKLTSFTHPHAITNLFFPPEYKRTYF